MTIKLIKRPPNGVELRLEGRLDAMAAPAVQDAFLKVAQDYAAIVLDFSQLSYISSAGLRTILVLQKQVNRSAGSLKLINVEPAVMEVFEMTGFSGILNIQ